MTSLPLLILMFLDQCLVVYLQERSDSLMFVFPSNYSVYEPPREADGSLVKLTASVVPFIVDNIVGDSMDFEANFFLFIQWNDTRLTPVSNFTLVDEEEFVKKLWLPEIQFRNCRDCTRFSFKKAEMLLSYSEQEFTWVARKTMKFMCELEFQYYPMDTQECTIQIESYPVALELTRDLRLDPEIKTVEDIAPAQFTIIESKPVGSCDSFAVISRFKCVEYKLILQRQMSYHMTFTYLPSIMIVMVSWISFWLDVEMVSPRAALGLTPLLALITQFAGTQKSLPPVAYMKAIDLWMFVCIFLVFASLIEFAVASYVHTRSLPTPKVHRVASSTSNETQAQRKKVAPPPKRRGSRVDNVSRYLFPIGFLLFNICYWSFYLG